MTLRILGKEFIEINTQNGTYLQYRETIIAHRHYNYTIVSKVVYSLMEQFSALIVEVCGTENRWVVAPDTAIIGTELAYI